MVWGPKRLQTSVSAEDLRSMVADALDVSFHRVRLAGAELIDGQMSLKILGDLATSYIKKLTNIKKQVIQKSQMWTDLVVFRFHLTAWHSASNLRPFG